MLLTNPARVSVKVDAREEGGGGGRERGSVRKVSLKVGRTRFGGRGVGGAIDFFDGAGDELRLIAGDTATFRDINSEDVLGTEGEGFPAESVRPGSFVFCIFSA